MGRVTASGETNGGSGDSPSQPSINPLLDQTGQNAALGQSGEVWFLAGTTGGSAERTVTVPPGKALFFPIVNNLWINIPYPGR